MIENCDIYFEVAKMIAKEARHTEDKTEKRRKVSLSFAVHRLGLDLLEKMKGQEVRT